LPTVEARGLQLFTRVGHSSSVLEVRVILVTAHSGNLDVSRRVRGTVSPIIESTKSLVPEVRAYAPGDWLVPFDFLKGVAGPI